MYTNLTKLVSPFYNFLEKSSILGHVIFRKSIRKHTKTQTKIRETLEQVVLLERAFHEESNKI